VKEVASEEETEVVSVEAEVEEEKDVMTSDKDALICHLLKKKTSN